MSNSIGNVGPERQGDHFPARRHGSLTFTSGMTPRVNGAFLFSGPVRMGEPVENFREAIRIAGPFSWAALETTSRRS